jgi:hypothetical protein
MSMEQMYVYFDMDEPTFLQIKRAVNEGIIARPRLSTETLPEFAAGTIGLLGAPFSRGPLAASSLLYPGRILADADVLIGLPVLMGLQGEKDFPHRGTIDFVDNQANPGTGSISVRGVFKNPRPDGGTYLMVPGMFVRVHLPIGQPQKSLLVDDRAVVSEQGQKKLYVFDPVTKKIQDRPVSLGSLQKNGWRVITHGLKKEDWVLIKGTQQVRPGMKIDDDKIERLERMPTLTEPAVIAPAEKGKEKGKGKAKK